MARHPGYMYLLGPDGKKITSQPNGEGEPLRHKLSLRHSHRVRYGLSFKPRANFNISYTTTVVAVLFEALEFDFSKRIDLESPLSVCSGDVVCKLFLRKMPVLESA